MQHANESNFQEEVVNFKGTVLVDFYADWCGPCKMLSPLLEQMSKENTDAGVKFVKINVDENQQLSGQFGIMSIPTVVFFKNGKFIDQLAGFAPKEVYAKAIEELKKVEA